MVLLPFIPHKAHAIDRLCRSKLQHLAVAPAHTSPLAGVNWVAAPKPGVWMALSAAKVPAIATATAGIAAAAVSGTLIVMQPAAPTEQPNPLSTNEMHNPIGAVVDTLETGMDTLTCQQIPIVETMCTSSLPQRQQTPTTKTIPKHPAKQTAPVVPPLSETPCPCEEGAATSSQTQSDLDDIKRSDYATVYVTSQVASKRALEPFTSLTVSSHIDVIIARGDESTAYITADSNVIDYVLTEFVEVIDSKTFEVLGRNLTVSLKRGAPKTDSPISVTIYTPHLKEVTLKEMSSVTAREINEDTFTVINQSSGRFKCDCLVAKKELVLENNGVGTIDVQYLCYNTLTIKNKSAGSITATETMTKGKTSKVDVQNLSVGYISLAVLEVCVLDLKNRGWGSISVQGRAENLIVENGCVGNIKADGLIAHSAYITHKGTGSTNVHVPKDGTVYLLDGTRLSDVKITGGGKVVTKK